MKIEDTKAMPMRSVAIIGGGIIGIAVARECAKAGYETVLFEAEELFGAAQSTRNSGVRHAGLLYRPGSLKARLCVRGGKMLDEFCARHDIPRLKTGKLIVAHTAEEIQRLDYYAGQGKINGVSGIRKISAEELLELEPNVAGSAALLVPETAVFDAGAFLRQMVFCAEAEGVRLFAGRRITGIVGHGSEFVLRMRNADGSIDEWGAECVINSAGVAADEIARFVNPELPFCVIPARGEYYKYRFSGKPHLAIRHCIYGLPEQCAIPDGRTVFSSGMHCVPTLAQDSGGGFAQNDTILIGPTVKVVNRKDDYESERFPVSYFYEWARRMLPDLREEDLEPDFSGIRAECAGYNDFVFYQEPLHPKFLNLFGFRSPALTASLAIGEYVVANLLRI